MTDAVKVKADIMWAYLDKVNDMSGKFQVDLCNLSEKAAEALQDLGLEVKFKEGKGKYITCKSTRPIYAFDDGGSQLEGQVGNGSKGVALVGTYSWSYQKKKGTSPALKRLVITDMLEYTGAPVGDLVTEDDLL
jgi:hypothetical protein|tara:strand:+ start:1306 stop:1707 length:402 start_codon:yes stop_codon:yes gene_type:complete